MFRYGKTTQHALSVMSLLAERESDGLRTSSLEVAKARKMAAPLAAKIMRELSTAGLLDGHPGPGGGYRLSRAADQITLWEIVTTFERSGRGLPCPFGPDWCGHGDPCPLHDQLAALDRDFTEFLQNTRLSVFARNGKRQT
jgi:Rrf2 family transcriptional regulator, iron-sulfur cluster assembly transcription factor